MKIGPFYLRTARPTPIEWAELAAIAIGLASTMILWVFCAFPAWGGFMIGAMPIIAILWVTKTWRTERGIWMLCAFFGSVAAAFVLLLVFETILDVSRGRVGAHDWALGGSMLMTSLAVVAIAAARGLSNFTRFRRGQGPFGRPPGFSPVPAKPRSPKPSLAAHARPSSHSE